MRQPFVKTLQVLAWCLPWLVVACQQGPHPTLLRLTARPPTTCSQIHRDISIWQGEEIADCGPDVSGLIELTPVGNSWLLARKRFSPSDDLWQLTARGETSGPPARVNQVMGAAAAGFTFLPGPEPRVLVYDPRSSRWDLYATQTAVVNNFVLSPVGAGQWPAGYWPPNQNGGPWDHQFVGLEDGNILDRDLGDGATRIWSVVSVSTGISPNEIVPSDTLVARPQDAFRRGHRLVHLGPRRLLEWLPRPCANRNAANNACSGSDFNVWSYALDAAAEFNPQIISSGFWSDVGDESDIVADGAHLFVWTRASGRLRSYAIDPTLADPLGHGPDADPPALPQLMNQVWDPPTSAPAIKHLVVILQDGRSFDSYFGRYCQGAASADGAPSCTIGAACCEAMPAMVSGAAACTDPANDPTYRPADSPACMRAKIDGGTMDGFAVPHSLQPCGDPRDFACAAVSSGVGAIYRGLAQGGALADRFFQTYAFEDGVPASAEPDPLIDNLLYLVAARFASFPTALIDTPLLTKELARLQVPWAVYAGPKNRDRMKAFGVPIFYDPDWFPFRSLDRGELEHDITAGMLPAVTVVLPDRGDAIRSEAPGQPPEPGAAYVQSLANAIAASPYERDTLVVVTDLTAGGFYDHVPPPPSPERDVDGSSGSADQSRTIHYGPRVPFLALGRFARTNYVSHVPLEISSITKFIEWNWLHGSALKGGREGNDVRRYRDGVVNNLGSVIDAEAAGIEVPAGPE